MKKYKKMAYIILALIIIGSGFAVYKVFGKNDDGEKNSIKSKSLSEVRYLESKFLNLFNEMNNIRFEHYRISTSEIKQENSTNSGTSSEEETKSSSGGSGGSETESNSDSGGGKSSSSSKSSNSDSNSLKDNKQYKLEEKGILTKNEDIDWNKIKNEVENIYTSLSIITLDLYKTDTNNQDILSFNTQYDNLTMAVKDEDKEKTLIELSKLYDYIPKFIESCSDNKEDKILYDTKNNIFKAYTALETEDWNVINEYINNAKQEFTSLVTNVDETNKNQNNVNKAYIMINELQNAVNIKDTEIFLIKYKNLLEELQNM